MMELLMNSLPPGRAVHRDNAVALVDNGGRNGFIGNNNGAVCGTAAHFGAVGGKPADIFALIHAGIRKELTDEQNALTAEACENISPKHNLYLLGDVFLNAERIIGDHGLFERCH